MPYEPLANVILTDAFAAPAGNAEIEEIANDLGDGRTMLIMRNHQADSAAVAVTLPCISADEEDGEAKIRLLRGNWERRMQNGVVGMMEQDGRLARAVRLDRRIEAAALARLLEILLDRSAAAAPPSELPSTPVHDDPEPGWVPV